MPVSPDPDARPAGADAAGGASAPGGEAGGYLRDAGYLYEFFPDHGPAWLNTVAALNGFAPRPLDDGFTWCDLGCGHGVSALALAAAFPRGRFHGVDLNPAHVAFAEALARDAGLKNVRFRAGDAAALSEPLPPLDFAVVHGVISWIDDTTRARLLDGVMAALKPNGLMMISYDALPGWAAHRMMRDMMVNVTRDVTGDSLARAEAAVVWLRRLRAGGATFFRDHPALGRAVDEMRDDRLTYVAHEYFNAVLRPFAFNEVRTMLEARGGQFVGRAELFLNIIDLCAPEALHTELAESRSRAEFEARRDFLRNETLRRDVYVKGAPLTDAAAWDAAQDGLRFGAIEPVSVLDRDVPFGGVRVRFDGPPFDDAMAHWNRAPGQPLPDAAHGGDPALGREITRMLAAARLVEPMAPRPDWTPSPPPDPASLADAPLAMPLAFNRVACRRLGMVAPRVPLAAPAAGAVVDLSAARAWVLLGLCTAGRAAAPSWTLEALDAAGQGPRKDGRALTGDEAHALLTAELDALFADGWVSRLVQLGVLTLA
ncbi:class I SAM-dependent methyltransferase [Roseospira visakhapatnamensis]|uniref:Precorrin-6B methylase 2 n=1 Tax=Roseospira visakhapatnamensis TaxID=390880 RepID=A0A7W6W8L0_9PROT|nr:class I SAM-dependent methyltransferase [Roseospira visakhapatnamensis]MBB4265115.1 precorrin-6B methylase 2 [Roseospira visakhapatnamensis]